MAALERIELSVSGLLNGEFFRASGSVKVDETKGTKTTSLRFDALPPGTRVSHDVGIAGTIRGFFGSLPMGKTGFPRPLDLLGREFISLRSTTVGRYGTMCFAERGTVSGGVLRSELTLISGVRTPTVRGVGPLRDVITVDAPDILSSRGRYSLRTQSGRVIPVRFTHFFRSLSPNRQLFQRMRGRSYLHWAKISTEVRGRTLLYSSRVRIRLLP